MPQATPRFKAVSKSVKPLWLGPQVKGWNGGVTYSMLNRYLACPERFRLHYVEGLRREDQFSRAAEYGNMWHCCEEAHAAGKDHLPPLTAYCRKLCDRYPFQRDEVEKWFDVCSLQFPLYVQHWVKHPDVASRTPLLQEQVFDVPHKLPSGRTVRLRGKWDSVDLVGQGKDAAVWLQENKSKGEIDEQQIKRQLTADLQTMLYLMTLWAWEDDNIMQGVYCGEAAGLGFGVGKGARIKGVRYNVIKRPLSGGKGNIVQHAATKGAKCSKCKGEGIITPNSATTRPCPKCYGAGRIGGKPAETKLEYHERLAKYIKDEPDTYFMRWNVLVSQANIERFRRRTLDPVLENLTDDAEWWLWCLENGHDSYDGILRHAVFPDHCPRHFVLPFGIYSPLQDGGDTEYDEFLSTGSETGLRRVGELFSELKEGG
jgi:hypothetical protein